VRVAFLGLGRMGSELVLHALAAGHDVAVWNRSPEPARLIATRGARAASSAAAAVVGAEIVVTTLFGPDTVRDVVLAGDLPFEPNATWVDVTTVSPADTSEFALWADEHRLSYAHSPVIGSLAPARAGLLGVLLGGQRQATDAATPIVALWAEPGRLHVYDTPQKAAAGKLVANLALAVSLQGLVEALRLGHSGGLSTDEVLAQLLDKTTLAPIAAAKAATIRTGRFEDTQFSVNALAKDVRLMTLTAQQPLPALTAAAASLTAAMNGGHGEDDISAIARDDR
jgi:3-hydroxyisobutyrate dehydrogenase